MARDPNACAVCGMWCSGECARRWPDRTVTALRALVGEWISETNSYGEPLDRDAFGEWLERRESAR